MLAIPSLVNRSILRICKGGIPRQPNGRSAASYELLTRLHRSCSSSFLGRSIPGKGVYAREDRTQEEIQRMKRLIFLLVLSCGLALPSALVAQSSDHVEVGVFADYMNFSATDPHINFVGVGGRAAFNVPSQRSAGS
jgi:hypothetical protein